MTAVYGASVIAGQVVMVAGTSASPEGVRVSVVGTGMSTLLGPDGRFTFSNVPQGAQLHFMRDDGIDARVAVPSTSAPFTVEINGNSAQAGRHRAAGVPAVEVQIEGTIVTPGSDSLVVYSSQGDDLTVKLTDSTVIRHGQTVIKAADLKAGDQVITGPYNSVRGMADGDLVKVDNSKKK